LEWFLLKRQRDRAIQPVKRSRDMSNEPFAVSAAPLAAWLAILSCIIITYLISLQARHIRRFLRAEANRERLGLTPNSHSSVQRPFRPLARLGHPERFARTLQQDICLGGEQTLPQTWTRQTATTGTCPVGNAIKIGNAIILNTRASLCQTTESPTTSAVQQYFRSAVGHA
jgi:hypothetical protein